MELFEECPICLNEYDQKRHPVFLLPCRHIFCEHCVSILTSKECPLCRVQFNGTQKNLSFLNNFLIHQLSQLEAILDENYHKALEIFDQNSKNLANTKQIFQLNFEQLQNDEFKTGFAELFNSKLKNQKLDEIKFYFISLKYSAFKEELKEKMQAVKTSDDQVWETNFVDEINMRIERFLAKESLVQNQEFVDGKVFYQECYSEFIIEKFGYLKTELEISEKLLDHHLKKNTEIFTRNKRVINEIISKLELKKLPKDINLNEFKEMVNERLHVKLLIENFQNFEHKFDDLKRSIQNKKIIADDLVEFCEYDLLDQKSQIEDLITKVDIFIKLNRIEKLSFRPFETSYLTFISDYKSNHSKKYKIINHLLKI